MTVVYIAPVTTDAKISVVIGNQRLTCDLTFSLAGGTLDIREAYLYQITGPGPCDVKRVGVAAPWLVSAITDDFNERGPVHAILSHAWGHRLDIIERLKRKDPQP